MYNFAILLTPVQVILKFFFFVIKSEVKEKNIICRNPDNLFLEVTGPRRCVLYCLITRFCKSEFVVRFSKNKIKYL